MNSKSMYPRISLILVATVILGTGSVTFPRSECYQDTSKTYNPENGHWYQRIDTPMRWHAARDYCTALGGHLATIGTASENDFVYNLASGGGWLGATDEAQEGVWQWVTGEAWSYTNWAPHEPNNGVWPGHDGPYEHYLNFKPEHPGQWNDVPDHESPFICEWESSTPADLARLAVGKQYNLAIGDLTTKGWDNTNHRFMNPEEITGLDCSGLVYWAYNKAYGATRYQDRNNPVFFEGADGQYRNNTAAISEDELRPGDLLFFDWNGDGYIQHVAMYVGDNLVVSAQSRNAENCPGTIAIFNLGFIKAWRGFVGFRRIASPTTELQIQAHSPVNLVVTDPNGNTINHETYHVTDEEIVREVPGILYYTEWDSDSDGELDASVIAPVAIGGEYTIHVVPKPSVPLTATYGLDAIVNGIVTTLAQDVQIADIPQQGYSVTVVRHLIFLPLIRR